MTRVEGNHPIPQRIGSPNLRWPADLEHQIVAAPPGAIPPDRFCEIRRQRQLIAAGLIPVQFLDQSVTAVSDPIHVPNRTIEAQSQASLGFSNLERNPLSQRDSECYPIGEWCQRD
jgi:hypothetical protein